MVCEVCGYKFLFASSRKCPSCGDLREAIVVENYDFLTANTVPIMDSIVGLKAANAHLTRRVAELGAENIELHDARRAIAIDAKARIETLESKLAAQALAHAEQMEARDRRIASNEERLSQLNSETTRLARLVEVLHHQMNFIRTDRDYAQNHAMVLQDELAAMRVTPTTQPTDAQQTASDVKAAPERRPDGTLKPAAKAWEAPRQGTDRRMVGQ